MAPVIAPFGFSDHEYALGMSAQLNCFVVEGDLPVDVSWTFHGVGGRPAPDIETTKIGSRSSILNIDSVGAHHSGNYTCIARNAAAARNFTATLNVYGRSPASVVLTSRFPFAPPGPSIMHRTLGSRSFAIEMILRDLSRLLHAGNESSF